MRRLLPIILIVAVIAVVYTAYVRTSRQAPRPQGPVVTVSFLEADLGGGVLVRTPEGQFTIIDPGPARSANNLADYLDDQDASKLDIVVSNPSANRAGALTKLLERFVIRRIVHGEMPATYRSWNSAIEDARTRGIAVIALSSGERLGLSRNTTLEAVSPPNGLLKAVEPGSDDNSLVTRLRVGGKRFLLLSDGGMQAEAALLKSGTNLESDVLWVARHGKSGGTSLELLASVRPHYCVVTAGGRFGRPRRAALDRIDIKNTGATVYRTDRNGTIDFITDGRTMSVEIP